MTRKRSQQSVDAAKVAYAQAIARADTARAMAVGAARSAAFDAYKVAEAAATVAYKAALAAACEPQMSESKPDRTDGIPTDTFGYPDIASLRARVESYKAEIDRIEGRGPRESKITPALTPAEWKNRTFVRRDVLSKSYGAMTGGGGFAQLVTTGDGFFEGQGRHALAALALDGLTPGFTWADVDALRSLAGRYVTHGQGDFGPIDQYDPWISHLADRIEALLPPRDK